MSRCYSLKMMTIGLRSSTRKYCSRIARNVELTFNRAIKALPRTLQGIVDLVERETGYAMVILWGGPQVGEDGTIRTWQYVQF